MILDILQEPDARLHEACPDAEPGPESARMLADMLETLEEGRRGVGLAAPQVGWRARAIVVLDPVIGRKFALLNPCITKRSAHKLKWTEGCLSRPGFFVPTKRAYSVVVEATDAQGVPVRIEAKEALACAFQHEIDHLDGKTLFEPLYRTGSQRVLQAPQPTA